MRSIVPLIFIFYLVPGVVYGVVAGTVKTHRDVVQGMAKYRHDRSYNPEIAWAYLNYEPTPRISLRLGRLGTEFFMMADSRWVGYSYLTVRPPGDYFWYLPFYSIHGGDLAYTHAVGDGMVRLKGFYGLSNGHIPLADQQWEIKGSPMTGVSVEYQLAAWQVRAGWPVTAPG